MTKLISEIKKATIEFSYLKFILCFIAMCIYKQNNAQLLTINKNTQTYLWDAKSNDLKVFNNEIKETYTRDKTVHFSKEISEKLSTPQNWVFYLGVQSLYNKNKWLCMERSIIGSNFNLFVYDITSDTKTILINHVNTSNNFAFRPVAWAQTQNKVYIEKVVLDEADEHEGVFELDLLTKEYTLVAINKNYMNTPIVSENRQQLIYIATSNAERDLVHGSANMLLYYDVITSKEKIISQDENAAYSIQGWYLNLKNIKKDENLFLNENKQFNNAQINFKLPWVSGITNCATRDGSNAPPAPIGSSSSCSNLGPHSYPAATDFDTPNNSNEKTLAVAAGTVTSVIYSATGYGNHVIITHADNYRTLYGHFFSIAVTTGQVVQQGCYLGYEGTTGNSSGDHIHIEYEYPGGSGNLYAVYDECNCVPHRGYNYTSGNSLQPCTPEAPANDICSNAHTLSVNFTCVNTAGTINNATAGTLTKPSCDGFTTPTLKDVWYKFTAAATNQTISVTPSTGFDAVLSLYNSCTGGEIACIDTAGNGATETIIATTLTVGSTYYIRVYDYGSVDATTPTFSICVIKPSITTDNNELMSNLNFKIYPNPSNGSFTVDTGGENELMEVSVFAMDGRRVHQQTDLEPKNWIHTKLPTGIYVTSIKIKDKIVTLKLLIDKK